MRCLTWDEAVFLLLYPKSTAFVFRFVPPFVSYRSRPAGRLAAGHTDGYVFVPGLLLRGAGQRDRGRIGESARRRAAQVLPVGLRDSQKGGDHVQVELRSCAARDLFAGGG